MNAKKRTLCWVIATGAFLLIAWLVGNAPQGDPLSAGFASIGMWISSALAAICAVVSGVSFIRSLAD